MVRKVKEIDVEAFRTVRGFCGLVEELLWGEPGSFQKSGTLLCTSNSRALTRRTPAKRNPNLWKQPYGFNKAEVYVYPACIKANRKQWRPNQASAAALTVDA